MSPHETSSNSGMESQVVDPLLATGIQSAIDYVTKSNMRGFRPSPDNVEHHLVGEFQGKIMEADKLAARVSSALINGDYVTVQNTNKGPVFYTNL